MVEHGDIKRRAEEGEAIEAMYGAACRMDHVAFSKLNAGEDVALRFSINLPSKTTRHFIMCNFRLPCRYPSQAACSCTLSSPTLAQHALHGLNADMLEIAEDQKSQSSEAVYEILAAIEERLESDSARSDDDDEEVEADSKRAKTAQLVAMSGKTCILPLPETVAKINARLVKKYGSETEFMFFLEDKIMNEADDIPKDATVTVIQRKKAPEEISRMRKWEQEAAAQLERERERTIEREYLYPGFVPGAQLEVSQDWSTTDGTEFRTGQCAEVLHWNGDAIVLSFQGKIVRLESGCCNHFLVQQPCGQANDKCATKDKAASQGKQATQEQPSSSQRKAKSQAWKARREKLCHK